MTRLMRPATGAAGRRARNASALLVVLVIGMFAGSVLAGCGSALQSSLEPGRDAVAEGALPGEPLVGADGAVTGPKAGQVPGAVPAPGGSGGGGDETAPLEDGAKIVRTGTLTLEVDDVSRALTAARREIDRLGGYVGASVEDTTDDRTYASITYRIPADRWDEAIAALRALATTVVGEQTQALEVTGQLVDLEARIDNLRASETALQEILSKATKVTDILEVESRLSDVRGQIEMYEAQRASLENQVAYGTLTVGFSAPIVAVTQAQEGWDPLAEVDRAVAAMLGLLQGIGTGAIWFGIVVLPVVLAVMLVVGIVLIVGRRLLGGRRPSMSPPSPPTAGPAEGSLTS
jgi:hypothetical protein